MRRLFIALALLLIVLPSTSLSAEPALTISKVTVTVKKNRFGQNKGKPYLTVAAKAKVNGAVPDRKLLAVKAACVVGPDIMVDKSMFMGAGLDDMEPGQTKAVEGLLFMMESALDAAPSRCDLSFYLTGMMGGDEPVSSFCWNKGKVSESVCPK